MKNKKLNEHYLFPGAIFAHTTPHLVRTILGSCVAVCIWDPILRVGGINHFQLPLWNGTGLASPKYGNIAIDKLIKKMLSFGSQQKELQVKLFGGAEIITTQKRHFNIGERNIMLALDVIKDAGIPIVSSALGGQFGRKIRFYTESGDVLLQLIKKTNHSQIIS